MKKYHVGDEIACPACGTTLILVENASKDALVALHNCRRLPRRTVIQIPYGAAAGKTPRREVPAMESDVTPEEGAM